MTQRRSGQYPPSWGASHALANTNLTRAQCRRSSFNSTGAYTPAVGAGAPNVTKSCFSEVLFTVNATTVEGQNVYIAGDVTKLGGALNDAGSVILPLNPGNYTSARHEWFVDIWLAAGKKVAYQYVMQQANGSYTFEGGQPRHVTVPPCGSGKTVTTNDAARFS